MRNLVFALVIGVALAACHKPENKPQAAAPVEVTVLKVVPRNTPVTYEFVGQTQSSRQVQIMARVNGFLDRRVYTEGSLVKAGDVMFLQDPKPFQVQVDAASAALAEQQARLQVARENLARVRPLAERNALSKRELDDAVGQELAAAAAVEVAKANLEQARLNLGYTRITTPVTGLSSFARVQDGQYVNITDGQLTYVSQMDPIWVNFSISENDQLAARGDEARGLLKRPADGKYAVELILADGTTFPRKGVIDFANADFNQKTGTYDLRATLPNPGAVLRPGMFVRVRVIGMVRPGAILVPQQSVLQGAQGHFVVLVDNENKAQIRPVQVGPWQGEDWFILSGLKEGDVVVTDGMVRLSPGTPVKVVEGKPKAAVPTEAPAKAPKPAGK